MKASKEYQFVTMQLIYFIAVIATYLSQKHKHTHKYKNIYIYNKNPERFGEIFVDMYENIVLS